MTCPHARCSVSPLLTCFFTEGAHGHDEEPAIVVDEEVQGEHMVWGDPIVGQAPADEYSTVIRGLPSPKEMTVAEYELHCLTHLPYNPACSYCAQAKKPNCPHHRSPGGRKVPLLVADYGFLTMQSTQEVIPYLCVHIRPWKVTFATVVNMKGPDGVVVRRLAQLIQDVGLTHVVYRSDREPALTALVSQAVKLAGVKGEVADPDDHDGEPFSVPAAVPEESHVGGSQSNGLAERAIQMVSGQVRCMQLNLEGRLGVTIPCNHPVLTWMVEYAALRITK